MKCLAIGPYSQAYKSSSFLFISVQIPIKMDGNLTEGTITEKTLKCIEKIKEILAAARMSLDRVAKVTVISTSIDGFNAINARYESIFKQKPARSCVTVQ